jgi:hypothetical protein
MRFSPSAARASCLLRVIPSTELQSYDFSIRLARQVEEKRGVLDLRETYLQSEHDCRQMYRR